MYRYKQRGSMARWLSSGHTVWCQHHKVHTTECAAQQGRRLCALSGALALSSAVINIIGTTPCDPAGHDTQYRDAAACARHMLDTQTHTLVHHSRWCADAPCQGQAATRTHAHSSRRGTLFTATRTLLQHPSGRRDRPSRIVLQPADAPEVKRPHILCSLAQPTEG